MKNRISLNAILLVIPILAYGHQLDPIGELSLDWQTRQISGVSTAAAYGGGRLVSVGGKSCMEGKFFNFDVYDQYAFDVDENIQLEIEFYMHSEDSIITINYDSNGDGEKPKTGRIPAYESGSNLYKIIFTLQRARFSNHSSLGGDFSISGDYEPEGKVITICNVSLKRSYETSVPEAYGDVTLNVVDETGLAVPARVGIYDANGRLPLPSNDAVEIKMINKATSVIHINSQYLSWPRNNAAAFYINGVYKAKLPVGRYELVISKGPEYHIVNQYFDIERDKIKNLSIGLKRWENLPAKGWYSGDNHIHYIRDGKSDDKNLLLFIKAEDLHVANILQMGNISRVHWPQYGWDPVAELAAETYWFVPGQEDPRTARLGHIISLNLNAPIRDSKNYLLYHPIFERARAQGAVVGYGHMDEKGVGPIPRGAALDVPYELVDFFEVMQQGTVGSERWFDFLNLGYKLAPSAGTDYMVDFTLPGAERSYVHIDGPFTLQRWFDGLKRGKTFVTNGPMLEFGINGQTMGSVLELKSGDKIVIDAVAYINPDIDYLDSLELIEQGKVIKRIESKDKNEKELVLRHETTAKHGSWFVVRANGKRPRDRMLAQRAGEGAAKMALSGAIYIYVDGKSFWNPYEVPAIVEGLKKELEEMVELDIKETAESWETRKLSDRLWESQKALLKQRIDQVMPIYDDLIKRAKAETEKLVD